MFLTAPLASTAVPVHHNVALGVVLGCAALLIGLFLHQLFFWMLAKLRHRSVKDIPLRRIILERLRRPALAIILLTALGPVLRLWAFRMHTWAGWKKQQGSSAARAGLGDGLSCLHG